MSNQKYSKKVLDHFKKPHNQGILKKPDGTGLVGNPKCGDIMRLYIKVSKNKKGEKVIKNVKFETLGCGAAIATTSMVTDLAKGKTLDDALKITKKNVTDELEWLPPKKVHCSNLAADALHEAIKDYLKNNDKKNDKNKISKKRR
jgi:nitrogen fixation protein NifU and related proteins